MNGQGEPAHPSGTCTSICHDWLCSTPEKRDKIDDLPRLRAASYAFLPPLIHEDPLMRNRSGISAPTDIPIRPEVSIWERRCERAGSIQIRGDAAKCSPENDVEIPNALHSRPGPLATSRAHAPPRLRCMVSIPSSGSTARINTALPNPSGSLTTFTQWYMP